MIKLRLTLLNTAIVLTAAIAIAACASSGSQHKQAQNRSPYHQHDQRIDETAKRRLILIGANLMRANAPACQSTRTIHTQTEEFEICTNKVAIEMSPVRNAHTNGKTILTTSALINALDDDELAFVIAHELAHSVAGHDIKNGSTPEAELEADYFATFLALRAGYDPKAGLSALKTLGLLKANPTDSHPAGADRVAQINKGSDIALAQKNAGQNIGPDEF